MLMSEAATIVTDLAKRPDKAALALQALQEAISLYTIKGEFKQDLVETTVNIDAQAYNVSIDLTLYPKFRKVKYLKITGIMRYLKKLEPEQVFTPGDTMQTNWYYRVGNDLNIYLNRLTPTLEFGYYKNAPTLSSNDTHWMLEECSTMITDYAVSKVFNAIGDEKSAQIHLGYSQNYFKSLLNDLAQEG